MNKLKMHTPNKADDNFIKLKELFPNAVTEVIDENGEVVRAIDKDILMQEINTKVVEGREERYEFNWPDKKKSVLLSNMPINKTLRPVIEDEKTPTGEDSKGEKYLSSGSVDFENTENLYIEGDNLEVLKLLQETYLGKIKMIYIDPPYNTGSDFVYEDDFSLDYDEYIEKSGQYDEEGNRLVKNLESNGRFHTDWLNMMYPRLKIAKDLLSDDGVIFISIDDNEQSNLKKICDEVFGEGNFVATIIRNTNSSKNQSLFISVSHEYCLVYAKNIEVLKEKHKDNKWSVYKNNIKEYIQKVKQLKDLGLSDDEITEELKTLTKYPRFIDFTNYWYLDNRGLYMKDNLGGVKNGNKTPLFNPLTNKNDDIPPGGFRYDNNKLKKLVSDNRIHFHTDGSLPRLKRYLSNYLKQRPKSIMSDDQRPDYALMNKFNTPFDNPKQLSFIKRIVSIVDNDSVILDFFSGSSTTAHAVMQLNAEDGGNRKFIMVQLPENTDEKIEAYKAGYKNICEIGKERIRRAGKKIKEENKDKEGIENLDVGFRVLKVDSSNMKDVYYRPDDFEMSMLDKMEDNIKEDRTSMDLLFQVMLDLGIMLSSKIDKEVIDGKVLYSVEDDKLIACFDEDLTEEVVEKAVKRQPKYFVTRDSSVENDSLMTNFEQIFNRESKNTVWRVI